MKASLKAMTHSDKSCKQINYEIIFLKIIKKYNVGMKEETHGSRSTGKWRTERVEK